MNRLKVKQVDVFTSGLFKGNPAGVVIDAGSLQTDEMQIIAQEMNFSQTAFLVNSTKQGQAKVRFFTPKTEIDLCGHALLATAHVLAEDLKVFLHEPVTTLKMDTNYGKINIEISLEKNLIKRITMILPPPEFERTSIGLDEIAKGLHLHQDNIVIKNTPLEIINTGLRVLIVQVKSLHLINTIIPHIKILEEISLANKISGLYVFCLQAENSLAVAHARFFAPHIGIIEESATGTAAGALGAFLVKNQIIRGKSPISMVIEQGLELKRPAEIIVEIICQENDILELKVGGKTKTTLEGEIILEEEGENNDS